MSYADYGSKPVICPYCSGSNVSRRIGRIRVARSEESRLENLSDPGNLDGLEENPKALGHMLKKMKSEVGGDDIGPEFDEVVGRLESGQSPEDIEQNMPDLGADAGGGDDDFGM
jgi:hypothetical protein